MMIAQLEVSPALPALSSSKAVELKANAQLSDLSVRREKRVSSGSANRRQI